MSNSFGTKSTKRSKDIHLDLDTVGGGKAGTLKPALGFKIGYIFEGFWTVKEKSTDK
ncbi:MAG: hypothetical protein BWY65_01861 [Firmicutes bacterium ADurb.Bin373]|nr:MAG: hypothetical protein BWY65_01861 [Firmicutes bacterium ADurb.Bin373]